MTNVELDLDDDLYNELETLADEEGITVEELIVDILKDEFALDNSTLDEDEDDDSDDEENDLTYDDDTN